MRNQELLRCILASGIIIIIIITIIISTIISTIITIIIIIIIFFIFFKRPPGGCSGRTGAGRRGSREPAWMEVTGRGLNITFLVVIVIVIICMMMMMMMMMIVMIMMIDYSSAERRLSESQYVGQTDSPSTWC